MTEPGFLTGQDTWVHASLTLVQPAWPGVAKAYWVAATVDGEMFRVRDALEAMNRLGAAGWELAVFFPEAGDRSACFYFKAPAGVGRLPGDGAGAGAGAGANLARSEDTWPV